MTEQTTHTCVHVRTHTHTHSDSAGWWLGSFLFFSGACCWWHVFGVLTWAASGCVEASCHCLCLWVVAVLMPQVSPGLPPRAQGWQAHTLNLGYLGSQALLLQGKKGAKGCWVIRVSAVVKLSGPQEPPLWRIRGQSC